MLTTHGLLILIHMSRPHMDILLLLKYDDDDDNDNDNDDDDNYDDADDDDDDNGGLSDKIIDSNTLLCLVLRLTFCY